MVSLDALAANMQQMLQYFPDILDIMCGIVSNQMCTWNYS